MWAYTSNQAQTSVRCHERASSAAIIVARRIPLIEFAPLQAIGTGVVCQRSLPQPTSLSMCTLVVVDSGGGGEKAVEAVAAWCCSLLLSVSFSDGNGEYNFEWS